MLHAAVQGLLTTWFGQHRQEWELHVLPEIRIRVSANRVRIADVCLVLRGQPIEQVLTNPPLAVIEILSPEDRISRYNECLTDYRQDGDPKCLGDRPRHSGSLRLQHNRMVAG